MREDFIEIPSCDSNLPFVIELAGISYCDGSYKICRNNSSVGCIEYVISGSGTIKTKGKTFRAKEKDTYFLLPHENHEYYSDADDPWVKIWINVSGELVDLLANTYHVQNETVFCCNSKPYIEKIHALLKDSSHSPNQIMSECALVFHELMQFLAKNSTTREKVSPDAKTLKNYIDRNAYSPITINDLAHLIYRSPSQTINIFKKAYNMTPYDYYMEKRIKIASSLLIGTTSSVKDIAQKLNFKDEHYFSALFKSKTGKKPTEFRK